MHHKTQIPELLLRLAAAQAGVLGHAQVVAHGVGRHAISRLVRDTQWHPVAKGIYSLSPSTNWTALAWAGVLLADGDGVLGSEAAMHMHGVGDAPATIVVWSGLHRIRDHGPWKFKQGSRCGRGSPPRVSLEDATLEVCAGSDRDRVVSILASAVTSRRTTTTRLRARACELVNLRHRSIVLEVLTDIEAGVESPLESRYLRAVEGAHGLPVGLRQVSLSVGTHTDVAYLDQGVLVELDGLLGHTGAGAWRDLARDNRHILDGLVTLRFGWNDVVKSPCAVATQVARVLTNNGWKGSLRRCAHCRSDAVSE